MLLDKAGVVYSVIDIKKDPNAMSVLDKYNFSAAPVVLVEENGTTDAWCGFRTDKLKALIETSAAVDANVGERALA
jgi:hypothetical protein